ncbi:hypothetical protein DFH09DRAFT_956689 [Mycena vulgaris]|nr:hypothetical protein DFH09DRAFT_956689 [Mycena vulgaris]
MGNVRLTGTAQTAKLMAQFMERLPYLTRKVLADEADAAMGTPCPCATGAICEVQCRNCMQYAASCRACFIATHRNNPFHWAEVWDESKGFFVRHNMSALGQPLQLGHHGNRCAFPTKPMVFEIIAETGPQALNIQFCGHFKEAGDEGKQLVDRVDQLLNARLFPCTFEETQSAVTFNALKQFQLHHLESKVAAFDYCGALRRLSDNTFTASVPDLYENFIRCSRMWAFLTTRKHLGVAHGIHRVLPYRAEGSTVVVCPTCPEPGFNMDPQIGPLPPELRHLSQERVTVDGNFHCTKSTKNSDPNDYSLYKGDGFFPTNTTLNDHLKSVPPTKEKSTCNYLKAVNNQDKKKFKNMEITGIVNTQCSHVFIKTSVDLQFGERYANVDLALALAIRQKLGEKYKGDIQFQLEFDSIDRVVSYDAACQYSVNVVERFERHFPDLADIVRQMRWAVPALHIGGHQEECMYKFGASYMVATGRFHGETAEVYWPELNQIGTQVCQQSGGHRQDTIMNHHNDWNFKKMAKSFGLLLADLRTADMRFEQHERNFLGLCTTYAGRITREGWMDVSREPVTSEGKYTKSVYRHKKSKVPTLLAIYEMMLEDEAAMVPNTKAGLNVVGALLHEGILIHDDQVKTRKLVAQCTKHFSKALKQEIQAMREQLQTAIANWRKDQKSLMPAVEGHLNTLSACTVEDEFLGLPSDFTSDQREDLNISVFAGQEAKLREGAAYDALKLVKLAAQTLQTLRDRRKKNSSGVAKNTRSQIQLNDTERRRDLHIANYMAARGALMVLGAAVGDTTDFPALEAKDTFLKSRTLRRILGDSGIPVTEMAGGGLRTRAMPSGTVMVGRARPVARGVGATVPKNRATTGTTKKKGRVDGWIWSGKVGKMDADELREWSKEGDRIQWFRAEAEMERWREQIEIKLAEWRTTIRSFARYKLAWAEVAELQQPEDHGYIAYAKQKSAMFAARELEGRMGLPLDSKLGAKYGCIVDDDFDIVRFVQDRRKDDAVRRESIFKFYRETEAAGEEAMDVSSESSEEPSEEEGRWSDTDDEEDNEDDKDDNEEQDQGKAASVDGL